MRTLVQEMNISIANPVRIMVSEDLRYNLMLWGEATHVGGKQEEAVLNQGEPPGGVGQGGLASQLTWLQPFGLFCVWRFSVIGQCKVSQKNPGPDPEDEGVDCWWAPLTGTPWQRPARSSNPGSRLSSPMTAISLNILILNTSLC
jgi:hypothetical protein